MEDIFEPIVVDTPKSVSLVVKTLFSNDVKLVRSGFIPSDLEMEEITEIKNTITEHPEWSDYEVASWIIDNENIIEGSDSE